MLGIFFIFEITHFVIKIMSTKLPTYLDASVIVNRVHKVNPTAKHHIYS